MASLTLSLFGSSRDPQVSQRVPRISLMILDPVLRSFQSRTQRLLCKLLHLFVASIACTHLDGYCIWILELRLSWYSPGRGPDRVPVSESLIWVAHLPWCLCTLLGLWSWVFDGLIALL